MRSAAYLVITVLLGCGSSPPPPPEPLQIAPVPQPAQLGPIGDRAVLTVFFWPERWQETSRAVLQLGGALLGEEVVQILSESTFQGALRMFAGEVGVELVGLDGLDESRPIVVGIAELIDGSLNDAVDHIGSEPQSEHMSHRIVFPAHDPVRLEDALRGMLAGLRCEARSDFYSCSGAAIAIDRTVDSVVLRAALVRRARQRPAVLNGDLEGSPILTSALAYAASGDAPMTVYARPHLVRALFAMSAADKIGNALRYVDPEHTLDMLVMGLSELTGGFVRTSSISAEVDDAALGLLTSGSPGLSAVIGLTEHGQRVVDAGRAPPSSEAASSAGPQDGWLQVRTNLNTNAMLETAGAPHGFSADQSLNERVQAFEECGMFCMVHVPLSRPLGSLSMLDPMFDELAAEGVPIGRVEHADLAAPILAELSLDTARVAAMGSDRDMERLARSLGEVRGRVIQRQRTVIATLASRGAEPATIVVPMTDAGPIGPSSLRTEASRCLERFGVGVSEALRAYSRAPPQERSAIVDAARAQTSQAAACALADANTRASAEDYRSLLRRVLDGRLPTPQPVEPPPP